MANRDTALLAACERGDVVAARAALRAGANIEAVDKIGRTPLVVASENRHLAVVELLIDAGAAVDAQDGSGRTALMEVSSRGVADVMRALLDAGADPNITANLFGETALILAAGGAPRRAIPVLLEHHADPQIADRDGKTVLMWLVDLHVHGGVSAELIRPLVEAGADPDAQDDFGRTALMWAMMGTTPFSVRPAVLKELIDRGADVGLRDQNGETALFGLVRYVDDVVDLRNGRACLELLLAAGADRCARNNEGKTPLGVVNPDNPLVIELLGELGFER